MNNSDSLTNGSPLHQIKDWYQFQQLAAAFFRALTPGDAKREFEVIVNENGIGQDGGHDLLVEFVFFNVIAKHSIRWIVECKCWEGNLSPSDIDINKVKQLLIAKEAQGYLLICKGNVTDQVKKNFREMSLADNAKVKYEVWEGYRFWEEINKCGTHLIQTYFPDYFRQVYIDTNKMVRFEQFVEQYETELKAKQNEE